MFVMIVGGGKTGANLAELLLKENHEICVIEDRPDAVADLRRDLPGACIVDGDGSSPTVLEAAGIDRANVLAAVTREDEANLVVTMMARFEFRVPRIIARVNNPRNAWLFTPEMGVDVALNPATLISHLIAEEMSLGDMTTLLKLRKGQYSLVEEKVHPTAVVVGKTVREMHLPPECVLAAIVRKGELLIPHGSLVLQPLDEVLAVVHSSQVAALAQLLAKVE
jgi:trk system potassium uptake protein TrkA